MFVGEFAGTARTNSLTTPYVSSSYNYSCLCGIALHTSPAADKPHNLSLAEINERKNRMRREDDFAERRKHIADLTDEELYNRFWELVDQVVDPLLELGRKNTTPSVERAVLLRMGVSSLDTQKVVEGCMDRGLMGHGAGHVVYKVMKAHDLSAKEAAEKLVAGEYWDEVVASFK